MNPLEKLRADISYWRQQKVAAREALRVAEAVLPALEAQLATLQADTPETETPVEPSLDFTGLVSPTDLAEEDEDEGSDAPRFYGPCADQVLQALTWKPDQSSEDLRESLRQHGRAFGRGAIGYALRDLRSRGKIRESRRQGNLVFYSLNTE